MASQFQNEITTQVALIVDNDRVTYFELRGLAARGQSHEKMAEWLEKQALAHAPTPIGKQILAQLYSQVNWLEVVQHVLAQ